jgi:hypothetical protein
MLAETSRPKKEKRMPSCIGAAIQAWRLIRSALVRFAIALLIGVAAAGSAAAADFHVDNALSGSGDGRSWATAWRSLGEIDWRAIRPGDTLHISGGPSGRVYRETLTVGASGTASQPIVIRRADASGHDGLVTIDAQNSRYYGVVVDSQNHVVVRDLSVRNVGDAGVRVRWATAGVLIEGMAVDAGNPTSVDNTRGYDVRNSTGVVLRRNSYTTPTSSTAQTDGIYSMNNDGVRYESNRLIIANGYSGANQGHNDCIQSFQDKNLEVIANFCEQRNSKTGHSQGIFIQDLSGTALVQNNVVVSPNTNSACISMENRSGSGTNGRMLAYHNSGYGCAYGTMHIVRSAGTVARNNILVSPKANAQAMKVVPPAPPAANIDHNLLFTLNSSRPVMIEGSGLLTWSQWQAAGYDQNGRYGDPQFVDAAGGDLSLGAGSPAIDRGVTISAIRADVAGTSRPQGVAYDIGAYEYAVGGASAPLSSTGSTTTASTAEAESTTTTPTTETTTATSTRTAQSWFRSRWRRER